MESCITTPVQPKQKYQIKPRWKKGESGNPNGRPRKEVCFGDIAREMVKSRNIDITLTLPDGRKKQIGLKADTSFAHGLISALIREGMKGSVPAIKELIDRIDGKVSDKLELKSDAVKITFHEERLPEKPGKPE